MADINERIRFKIIHIAADVTQLKQYVNQIKFKIYSY